MNKLQGSYLVIFDHFQDWSAFRLNPKYFMLALNKQVNDFTKGSKADQLLETKQSHTGKP